MPERGQVFSLEALLAFLVLVLVILSLQPARYEDLTRLYFLQEEHDLLTVWLAEGSFDSARMVQSFQRVFPGRAGAIEVNGAFIPIGAPAPGSTALTESEFVASGAGQLGRLSVTVYLDGP